MGINIIKLVDDRFLVNSVSLLVFLKLFVGDISFIGSSYYEVILSLS